MSKYSVRITISFSFFLSILYIFGVPGIVKTPTSKICRLIHGTSFALFHLGVLYIVVLYSAEACFICEDFHCATTTISRIVWRILILTSYDIFCFKNLRIRSTLKELNRLRNVYSSVKRKCDNMITISMWTLIVFCLIIMVNIFVLLETTDAADVFFSDMLLKSNPQVVLPIKVILVIFFFITTKMLVVFAQSVLTLMYVSVSYFCSQLIKECRNKFASGPIHEQSVTDFMRSYAKVHNFVLRVEESFSWQILFLSVSNFIELFQLFSGILGLRRTSPIYNVENFASSFLSSISFFAIAVFASRVDTEYSVLRRVSKMAAFTLSLSKDTRSLGGLLSKFEKSRERLTLTACGLFRFTRSFLLTSSGAVLTYNLLILQIRANKPTGSVEVTGP